MLERGAIDAICTERAPDSFFSALDKVGRLFADSMAAERDYFQRSGNYPPMHLICVKRRFVEANPPPPGARCWKPSPKAKVRRSRDSTTARRWPSACPGGCSIWRRRSVWLAQTSGPPALPPIA